MGTRVIDSLPVPDDVDEAYCEAVLWLLRMDPADNRLVMSPEADRARSAFQSEIEPRLGPDGDLRPIADWAGNLTGAVCRIAGILHLAEHARSPEAIPPTIRGETFERAVRIGRYFLEHARAAFDAMESDETSELAKRVWAWLARKGLRTFTERDAQRAVHRAAGDTRAALAILVDRRLVRALPAPKSAGGQPPSQSYDVNPRARQ